MVATLRDMESGRTETVAARYLVACCAGQSTVPQTLGVQWEGKRVVSNHLNIYIRIPELWNHHDKGKAAFYFFVDPGGGNQNLVELDGDALWRFSLDFGLEKPPPDSVDVGGE